MDTFAETKRNGVHQVHEPNSIEATTSALEDKLQSVMKQLNAWRDSMYDLERKARQHPTALMVIGSSILATVIGGITVGVLENQRRNSFSYKFRSGLKLVRKMF